ncbi:unnamed protein product [Paramecium primaurelia]|uniref:Uncharacterized protein n=2 Tax=Paramecium TaxID=5884 RepID=A0A8S1W2V1_9CILI|nr:unnamed protein product [Paramecium primaurelia]CAD8183273.1 unnamed protein product [Paramecium pentaurelia]
MSLILKHHLILPNFKLNETIPFKNQKSNSITTLRSQQKTQKNQKLSLDKHQPTVEMQANKTDITFPVINKTSPKETTYKQNLTIRTAYTDDKTIKDYLDHLNTLRSQKNTQKQNKFKKVRTETEIVQYGDVKFKKVKESSNKKSLALVSNIRNPQSQSYIKFSQQIFALVYSLDNLKKYINNERKLFQVIKQLIGLKKSLKKIILKPNGEELVEFSEISKLCCVREIQYINGEQKIVDKFDLSLYDDLVYLTDTIENLLLSNEIHSINRISDNIQKETEQILKIQHSMNMPNEEQKLSVQTMSMQRFKIHDEIDTIEQKLGPLQLISRQVRQTSMVLSRIISSLNE